MTNTEYLLLANLIALGDILLGLYLLTERVKRMYGKMDGKLDLILKIRDKQTESNQEKPKQEAQR